MGRNILEIDAGLGRYKGLMRMEKRKGFRRL